MSQNQSEIVVWIVGADALRSQVLLEAAGLLKRPMLAIYPAAFEGGQLNVHQLANRKTVLNNLEKQLSAQGSRLLVAECSNSAWLQALQHSFKVGHFLVDYHSFEQRRLLEKAVAPDRLKVITGAFTVDPRRLMNGSGRPYQKFTPYYNRWLERYNQAYGLPPHGRPARAAKDPLGAAMHAEARLLEKTYPNFATMAGGVEWVTDRQLNGLPKKLFRAPAELPGQEAATPLQFSLDCLDGYEESRDFISRPTSEASTALALGAISGGSLLALVEDYPVYMRQLVWREFYNYLAFHFQSTVDGHGFKRLPGPVRQSRRLWQAWVQGKTGFALIDAGMRQLAATGSMHGRMRMLSANFLTRILHINYRAGEQYFASYLADFDLAQNTGNWQWSAGCGVDSVPYFRIFNPHTQLKKYDPELTYTRRWVPEYKTSAYPAEVVNYPQARELYLAKAAG